MLAVAAMSSSSSWIAGSAALKPSNLECSTMTSTHFLPQPHAALSDLSSGGTEMPRSTSLLCIV